MLQSYCFCVTQIEANISVSPVGRETIIYVPVRFGHFCWIQLTELEFFFINVLAAYNH